MEHATVSVATASPAQHSVTEFEENYIERLKLIVLDGTVNDIEVSVNRLEIKGSAFTGVLEFRVPYLFLIDNLDVTIDQKPFPFQHRRVPADLSEGDRLSLYQRRIRRRRE